MLALAPGVSSENARLLRSPPLMKSGNCWIALLSTTLPRSLFSVCSSGCLALDFHDFRQGADLQADIDARGGAHLHQDVGDLGLSKAFLFRAEVVLAGRQIEEAISAVGSRDHGLGEARGGILQGDFGAGTMAPELSVMVPLMVPRSWPKAMAAAPKRQSRKLPTLEDTNTTLQIPRSG